MGDTVRWDNWWGRLCTGSTASPLSRPSSLDKEGLHPELECSPEWGHLFVGWQIQPLHMTVVLHIWKDLFNKITMFEHYHKLHAFFAVYQYFDVILTRTEDIKNIKKEYMYRCIWIVSFIPINDELYRVVQF